MRAYILATLDTKGPEAAFVRNLLAGWGLATVLVDAGCLGEPTAAADVSRERLFAAAGVSLAEAVRRGDRGFAVNAAAAGAAQLIVEAHARGDVAGLLALGGSAGATIGAAAMRALPLGVPKVLVTTLASGQTRPYVGDKDLFLLNPVVDIAGLNRVSRPILTNAAAALAGMIQFAAAPASRDPSAVRDPCAASDPSAARGGAPSPVDKPLIAASMFGVTTPCVRRAQQLLEQAGYEVLVFHATGNGGQAMESLIAEGVVAGVLDITTTELADELVGGVLSAGPDRLTAASRRGVPQVVSVGALDMVNFGPFDTVPTRFAQRLFHRHNANVTLMRTTPAENALLGEELARKAAASRGPAAILLPLRGVSAIDRQGQPFDDGAARAALFEAIRRHQGAAELVEFDLHINDDAFAEACARKLLALMRAPARANANAG